ncbi:hydrolase [Alkalilimnicola ehrlichii]|uniref:Hydrolase n=1 Tax=Alkalilimnicola ehrlichii TaxID=351052 RepID=A0A3E0WZ98_9GAMM|nr:dienelactone hydrolase family protein [Alkalilimnicola ehrlichii]RFA30588.1 hydrolase [Alkalilimnicola ehrlichii]RFA38138.1 hydrolase [Alkalilimnicola ehrlichii]
MPAETTTEAVQIPTGEVSLAGDLTVPNSALGLVVFAHGSGSSRFSERNRFVARSLQAAGLGTLLFDLLTGDEERIDAYTAELRFDIDLLGQRLTAAVDWLQANPTIGGLGVGLFGASTGAAAALKAAAQRPGVVKAVVSRGGRPELAGDDLFRVRAPCLLLVGGLDGVVIELNRTAADSLRVEHELIIVPGATHLFPEPGALENVAERTRDWFLRLLPT